MVRMNGLEKTRHTTFEEKSCSEKREDDTKVIMLYVYPELYGEVIYLVYTTKTIIFLLTRKNKNIGRRNRTSDLWFVGPAL